MNSKSLQLHAKDVVIDSDGNVVISDPEISKLMMEAVAELSRIGNDAKIKILCCNVNIIC